MNEVTAVYGAALGEVWALLGGDAGLVGRVGWTGPVPLPCALPVGTLAGAAVGAAALAGAEYRDPDAVPEWAIDAGAVAAAFGSEKHLRLEGKPQVGFAPLSRFWPTADGGWVRTHANYAHHRERLLAVLGVDESAVGEAIAGRTAAEVEELVCGAGGLAYAVRTEGEWRRHPQGMVAGEAPLLSLERAGAAEPGEVSGRRLRVLDLTRVIAGPVGTRTLGFLGADVLRVDSPRLPEIPEQWLDSGWGKRSALLDLARRSDRETFEGLLAEADVLVTGYRPGALDQLGLGPEEVAERHPGLVVATLSAWGRQGPWAERRGFDSLVQAASGIALLTGKEGEPGALPVQALDHATGYLLAAAVLRALARRRAEGGSWHADLALARTAAWLLRMDRGVGAEESVDPEPYLREVAAEQGRVRYALPPFALPGGPRTWAEPVRPWGADAPVWR